MNGYIQKDDLVSLRGTLVPATTVNKVIGSIPVIGDLLVGKKAGEGVFGVSFKIKGYPNDLKTTVNPVKTLTPRFITRTLEKLKNVGKAAASPQPLVGSTQHVADMSPDSDKVVSTIDQRVAASGSPAELTQVGMIEVFHIATNLLEVPELSIIT